MGLESQLDWLSMKMADCFMKSWLPFLIKVSDPFLECQNFVIAAMRHLPANQAKGLGAIL
jgi:hypothetical protein